MLNYLLGFTKWEAVPRNAMWGALWESLVISEAYKYFCNSGIRPPCWFWRTVQGEEVDLLIETGPREFATVACKSSPQVDSRALKGFAALEKYFGAEALRKAAVVCRTEKPYPLASEGRIVALSLSGADNFASWLSGI
jgi:uncharacterized protein